MLGVGGQYLGIGRESDYADAVPPTRLLEAEQDDFIREQTVYSGTIDGIGYQTRPANRVKSTLYGAQGSIQMPVFHNGMGILWRSVFSGVPAGQVAWTAASGGYYKGSYRTHFKRTAPSYTITVYRAQRDGTLRPFHYNGMVCTQAEVSVNERDPVMIRFDYVGEGELNTPLADTGTYPAAGTWFHHDDCELFIDGVTSNVRGFTLKCDMGLNPNIRYLTGELAGIRERDRPVRVDMPFYHGFIDMHYTDDALYDKWIASGLFTLLLRMRSKTSQHLCEIEIPACRVEHIDVVSSPRYLTTAHVTFVVYHQLPQDAITVTYVSQDTVE